ncbi:MAG: hypothetical protein AAFU80_21875 [Pseudomonadota bacterium]
MRSKRAKSERAIALVPAVVALVLSLGLSQPASAQDSLEPLSRPNLMTAMGLVEIESVEVSTDAGGAPLPFTLSLDLPTADGLRIVPQDVPEDEGTVLAGFDFVTEDGVLAETLLLTRAQVEIADPEARKFAMANLLVLRAFPALRESYPDARMIGFGPIERDDDLVAVQMVGSFTTGESAQIVFRQIGLMDDGSEDVIIAIIYVNTALLPVRNPADIANTYGGVATDSLRLTLSDATATE